MADPGDLPAYELDKRLEAFRRSDQEREQLLRDLLHAFRDLEHKFHEVQSDFVNEQTSRRQWQNQAQSTEQKINLLQQEQQKAQDASSPVVAVLIDGDGAPFLDDFYNRGDAGGSEAASRLNDEVRRIIDGLYPDQPTSHWTIMVNIFTNMDGMRSKLRACGLLPPQNDLHAFCQAFVRNQPLFQIIDVGPGKEQADYKLREWFRLCVGNTSYKHIILGGICHDNGYLPMLEPYKANEATANRISLLATLPVQPLYKGMNYKPVRADSVFRSAHLPAKHSNASFENRPLSPARKPTVKPDDSALTEEQAPAPLATNGDSWAVKSKSSIEALKEINVATTKPAIKKYMLLNAEQERIDARLPTSDKLAADKLHRRVTKDGKVCNYYHLTGKCKGNCGFTHGERLPPGELNVLRNKARTRRCVNGGSCRIFECIFGHVCPYGGNCTQPVKCAFADVHGMDLIPAIKWFEDDQIEVLVK